MLMRRPPIRGRSWADLRKDGRRTHDGAHAVVTQGREARASEAVAAAQLVILTVPQTRTMLKRSVVAPFLAALGALAAMLLAAVLRKRPLRVGHHLHTVTRLNRVPSSLRHESTHPRLRTPAGESPYMCQAQS